MTDLSAAGSSEVNAIYMKNSAVSNTFIALVIRMKIDHVYQAHECRLQFHGKNSLLKEGWPLSKHP